MPHNQTQLAWMISHYFLTIKHNCELYSLIDAGWATREKFIQLLIQSKNTVASNKISTPISKSVAHQYKFQEFFPLENQMSKVQLSTL